MPARGIQQAEVFARELRDLLSSSTLSELLQRTLSASLTAEQEALLFACCSLFDKMIAALYSAEAAHGRLMLEALLQQQAVKSAGTLIAWVQQCPERLLAMTSVFGFTAVTGSGAPGCWDAGVHFIGRAAEKAGEQDYTNAAVRQMAVDMMQQLDQSGKRWSLNCSMLVLRFEGA
jgi:hypothetical protein